MFPRCSTQTLMDPAFSRGRTLIWRGPAPSNPYGFEGPVGLFGASGQALLKANTLGPLHPLISTSFALDRSSFCRVRTWVLQKHHEFREVDGARNTFFDSVGGLCLSPSRGVVCFLALGLYPQVNEFCNILRKGSTKTTGGFRGSIIPGVDPFVLQKMGTVVPVFIGSCLIF